MYKKQLNTDEVIRSCSVNRKTIVSESLFDKVREAVGHILNFHECSTKYHNMLILTPPSLL